MPLAEEHEGAFIIQYLALRVLRILRGKLFKDVQI